MEFLEYELTSAALCMGERVKGAIFRPCDTKTIRYSVITGALRSYFAIPDLHAAGYLLEDDGHNEIHYFTYCPQDRATGTSKVPLTAQFLVNVLGLVYVKKGGFNLPEELDITMGALKSRGFGRCHLKLRGAVTGRMGPPGLLRTRIPFDLLGEFDVRSVRQPRYGYLFRPTSPSTGVYVRALFEGSEVVGPNVLVEEVRRG